MPYPIYTKAMPKRSSYHHGDLANALLDAAETVLQERGLAGFTLRECARRAGVSHSAPKHHFGDAQGLLSEIAARGFQRLTAGLSAEIAKAKGDLVGEFRATSIAYLNFAEEYPEHFRMMLRADLLCLDNANLFAAAQSTFNELTNLILRQRGEPEIGVQATSTNHEHAGNVIDDIIIGWTFVHGFAHLHLEKQLQMLGNADDQQERLLRAATRLSELLQIQAHKADH